MKPENREIFEEIGYLFYAVAMDQRIKPLEFGEMKLLISQEWMPRNLEENRSIVHDETHFILMTLDTLQASGVSARDAFNEFKRFYAFHQDIFTKELKQRIVHTCMELNRIFEGDNPSENETLAALKALFISAEINA